MNHNRNNLCEFFNRVLSYYHRVYRVFNNMRGLAFGTRLRYSNFPLRAFDIFELSSSKFRFSRFAKMWSNGVSRVVRRIFRGRKTHIFAIKMTVNRSVVTIVLILVTFVIVLVHMKDVTTLEYDNLLLANETNARHRVHTGQSMIFFSTSNLLFNTVWFLIVW